MSTGNPGERLERLLPQDMSAEQRAIYDRFTTGQRVRPENPFTLVHPDGGLTGPANAWLLSPPVGRALEQLGAALRYELTLSPRCREIAILLVGFHRDSAFELYAHRLAARSAGLADAEVDALATAPGPDFASRDEQVVQRTTRTLLANGTLDSAQYADALDALGERGLVELVVLVGYYQLVATQLAVFGVQPPAVEAAR